MNFEVPRLEQFGNERQIDPLLAATLYNEAAKEQRRQKFDSEWQRRYKPLGGREGYFQTTKEESPFGEYSSRGWKIHIAFPKNMEKEVARILYENGLYFKVEVGIGTYFNGLNESGATIYIGSYDNMEAIADFLHHSLGHILTDGSTVKVGEKIFHVGSGSDIEIRPKITARFDVAKTKFGCLKGNKKYSEYGLMSWTGLGGIPILKQYEQQVAEYEEKCRQGVSANLWRIYYQFFQRVYDESKEALRQDFGEEFLEGRKIK